MEYQDIKQLLNQDYNSENWKKIITAIFPDRDFFSKKEDVSDFYTDKQQKDFESIHQFGDITLHKDSKLALFEVKLPSNKKIAQNRVNLRSLVAKLVMPGITAGALVVFYAEEQKDWRFSFIHKDVKFEDGKEHKSETNRKRYTYVLGENETCKTPAKQFKKLIDKPDITIDDILDAFSVEKLSKEFFEKYKGFYKNFTELISQNPSKRALFDSEKQISDFVKKMLGRIVFLYFLQKKGWLGIGSEFSNNPNAKNYGKGDFHFLRNLLEHSGKNEMFYADYLAPLFYKTLNTKRDNDICKIKGKNFGKVPFLNGGLFENDFENYDSLTIDFDEFDKLFSFFEEYNFTIDENSIDDFDIGIDPEMLGHIFENLLDDNKDKGTFYTPKEIVHYMCQESLAEYLKTKLNNPQAEVSIENLLKNKEVDAYTKEHAEEIDTYLNDVKICDPAIGSGAFPIGLLLEIFQAKLYLHPYANPRKSWKPAKIKENIIQNSIYGVDIESGAVDIARLRFWLSLIVDEEIEEGEKPKPLPNLDYKIMQGNSLLESFEGIDLSRFSENGNGNNKDKSDDLFVNHVFEQEVEYKTDTKSVSDLMDKYFKETDKDLKNIIHKKIDDIINSYIKKVIKKEEEKVNNEIIELHKLITATQENTANTQAAKIKKQKTIEKHTKELNKLVSENEKINNKKTQLIKVQKTRERPYFLWHLYFKDVFDNGGFDIVIGNPPYIDIKTLPSGFVKILFEKYKTTQNRINLYAVFVELAYDLCNISGNFSYIIPNSILLNSSYKKIREYIINSLVSIVKLPDNIFNSATVETITFLASNSNLKDSYVKGAYYKNDAKINFENLDFKKFNKNIWKEDPNKRFNIFISPETFNLLKKINNKSNKLIKYCDFSLGITPYDKYKGHSQKTIEKREFHSKKKLNKNYVPLISGTNIKRYFVDENIKEYLYYGDWLGAPRQRKFFKSERIIVRQILSGKPPRIYAGYTTKELYFTQIGFSILSKSKDLPLKFLIAILNSNLLNFYHKYRFLDIEKITFQKILIENCKQLPIKLPENKAPFIEKADKILQLKEQGKDTSKLEAEIDQMVYKLYDLTDDEIELIENPEKAEERKQAKKEFEAKRTEQAKQILAQIAKGENQSQEFKSTLAYCQRQKKREKYIEHEAMKNIAAFLNSKGGTLFIGVDDDKNILGLENDFSTFKKTDKIDEFQKHLDNLIQNYLGNHIHELLTINFPEIDGRVICKIDVKPASSSKMLKNMSKAKEEEFYIRRSASAVKLSPSEMIKYIEEHF